MIMIPFGVDGIAMRRLTTVILLSMALVDLTWPGFCQAEELDFPLIPSQRTEAFNVDGDQQSPAPIKGLEDSCFCCCSHVLTTPGSSIGAVLPTEDADRIEIKFQRPLFPRTLFHPPRPV